MELWHTKVAALVQRAFASVKSPLGNMNLFHTDRGTEFKNVAIDYLFNTKLKDHSAIKGILMIIRRQRQCLRF